MFEFITVAKVGDIPEGEGRAFEYDDQMVAVFNDKGEYRAIDDMCPHMGASLATGHLEDSVVACPWHGWRFDTRDGAWCENRRIKIDVFQVRVVGDEIQIAAAEESEEKAESNTEPEVGGKPCSAKDPSNPTDDVSNSSEDASSSPEESSTGTDTDE